MRIEVSYEQVARALELAGLPGATAVEAVGRAWVHSNFRVDLEGGGTVLLRLSTQNPGWDTLLNELTALRLVPMGIPRVTDFTPLPAALFGRPAALTSFVPGRDGGVLAETEAGRAQLASHIGGVIGLLSSVSHDQHGTLGLGHQFSCRARTWREEWEFGVEESWARVVSAGLTLGDLGRAVMARVREGLGQLDGVTRFSLVHRDLHPNNLRVAEDGSLAAVIDWSDALVGDPQVEWASLVDMAPEHFAAIHQAAGRPDLSRLPIYEASRAIQRLGFCTLGLFDHDRGRLRALAIERAQLACTRVLTGVHEHLDHGRVPVRRAVEALRHLPGVRPHVGVSWLGGVASALAGDEPWSLPLIDRVDLQNHARPWGDVRPAIIEARVLGALPDRPQGALALACVALSRQADARLDHTVSPRSWAGLAELVEGLLRMEGSVQLPEADRAVHALIGRAACKVLGAPDHGDRFGPPLERLPAKPDSPEKAMDAMIPVMQWAQGVLSR